jgi:hypothetical protein
MDRYPDLERIRRDMTDPAPTGGPLPPTELGTAVGRLVWESFLDDLADPALAYLLGQLDVPLDDGIPPERALDELLIFHLWLHTRAVQVAFHGRADGDAVREVLDALHKWAFEEMVRRGTPRAHVPLFEQRVSARYAEYYTAADTSDEEVARVATRHMGDDRGPAPEAAVRALRIRAMEVSGPLRDYLEDVVLEITGTGA